MSNAYLRTARPGYQFVRDPRDQTGDSEHQEPLPRFPAMLHAFGAPAAPVVSAGGGMLAQLLAAMTAALKNTETQAIAHFRE